MTVEIKHLLTIADYDAITGQIIWRKRDPQAFRCVERERTRVAARWNKSKPGKAAGTINAMGYIVVCIEGKTYFAHRIAWAMHHGEWPNGQIDHINGCRSDNRLDNLRVVSAGENAKNKKMPKTNSSGSIGVHFHKPSQSWHARIMADGKRKHIGSFSSAEDASQAYLKAKEEMKFHKNHGRH